jgi:hypothetical protein
VAGDELRGLDHPDQLIGVAADAVVVDLPSLILPSGCPEGAA